MATISLLLLASGIGYAACAGAAGFEVRKSGAAVEVDRARPTDETYRGVAAKCDSEEFEPLDIALDESATLPIAVTLSPVANRILLQDGSEAQADELAIVRWFDVSRGRRRLLASRSWNLADPIPVSNQPRLIRVSHPAFGKFSFTSRAPEDLKPVWSVQEIVVLLDVQDVLPEQFTKADVAVPVEVRDGFAFAVVPVGKAEMPRRTLTIRPVYTGGVRGEAVVVDATADDLWVTSEELQPVGGVQVFAREFFCADLQGFTLAIEHAGVSPPSALVRRSIDEDCEPVIDGLPAGGYNVVLRDGERTVATGDAVVEEGARSAVPLERHVVEVWGSVRDASGGGIGGLIVTVGDQEVVTSGDGSFRMDLADDGTHEFKLHEPTRIPVRSVERTLTAGVNVVEIEVPGTLLEISVTADVPADPGKAIQLSLTEPSGRARGGFVFAETYPHRVRFFSVAPGSYQLFAISGSMRSPTKEIEIDADEATRYVDLKLSEASALLRVTDVRGQPLPASVQAGRRVLEPSLDGSYSLSGLGEGEPVRVAVEGYMPVCRLFRGSNMNVNLTRPTHGVLIRIPEELHAGHLSIEGATLGECLLGLPYFSPASSKPGTVQIELDAGSYLLRRSGRQEPLPFHVPGPPIVLED